MPPQVVARNGCAAAVSVVSRDAGLLQRGHEVRTRGVNLVVADFFDAGAQEPLAGTSKSADDWFAIASSS